MRPVSLRTKPKRGSFPTRSLPGPGRSNRNAHRHLSNCAAAHSPRRSGPLPSAAVRKDREVRAEPPPPSARPAQRRTRGSVTAGGSRNLATLRPRLRQQRRAGSQRPQNGVAEAAAAELREPNSLLPLPPRSSTVLGSLWPHSKRPSRIASKVRENRPTTRRVRVMRALSLTGRGAQTLSKRPQL
uniref:uncharacterized protein LOC108587710 n=1 Tax=Callithrix jacchus TaxID=9483 RepID=UPI0023DD0545|nr:uncharacterized protein LOC108587710 [Callithrix jacchus]XP_054096077.1 uncharacterized protein LOC108587710 [Callithrix jacchus]